MAYGVREVRGLSAMLRATDAAGRETKKLARDEVRKAAEPIRDEARRLFMGVHPKSALRYGVSVRKVGTVAIEQRLRRTTGKRPDFGGLQMKRALVPALDNKGDEATERLDDALERICDHWAQRGF